MQLQPGLWRSLFARWRRAKKGAEAPSAADVLGHEADHTPVPARGDAASAEERLKEAAERNADAKQGSKSWRRI